MSKYEGEPVWIIPFKIKFVGSGSLRVFSQVLLVSKGVKHRTTGINGREDEMENCDYKHPIGVSNHTVLYATNTKAC